jgi:RNA polymerase sigma-70 factor (ECF subfamily)
MNEGKQQLLGEWFAQHRERLRRLVALRLDSRLQGRIDPSDVIQEAYLEASVRYADYLRNPVMPPFLWLRFLTLQKLLMLHRHHLRAKMRDASRDVPLPEAEPPGVTPEGLAEQLLSLSTTPGQAAVRAEMNLRLQEALNRMDAADREILALRHFEELSNAEAAQVLGIGISAASKRYVRALKRLKDILHALPGWTGEV